MRDKQLDGLRGLAALGVVVFHGHYGGLFGWMWTFVDLFFVLSGFLITRIILGSLARGSFSFKNFMIRRILRIWPVYYITLAFCVLVVVADFVLTGEWKHTSGLLSAPFFLQFTHLYFEPSFNNGGEEDFISWFHHSWSIAVEEQFYLVMPLLLLTLRRRLAIAFGIILSLIPLAVYFRAQGADLALLVSRMDALCIGVALAFYWINKQKEDGLPFQIGRVMSASLMCLGLLLILTDLEAFGLSLAVAHALGLLGFNIVFGSVVLILMEGWLRPLNAILASRTMVFLGAISYALYLFHLPVRGVLLYLTGEGDIASSPLWVQVVYFGLSIFAAYVSKILIEDRANSMKHRFPVFAEKRSCKAAEVVAK